MKGDCLSFYLKMLPFWCPFPLLDVVRSCISELIFLDVIETCTPHTYFAIEKDGAGGWNGTVQMSSHWFEALPAGTELVHCEVGSRSIDTSPARYLSVQFSLIDYSQGASVRSMKRIIIIIFRWSKFYLRMKATLSSTWKIFCNLNMWSIEKNYCMPVPIYSYYPHPYLTGLRVFHFSNLRRHRTLNIYFSPRSAQPTTINALTPRTSRSYSWLPTSSPRSAGLLNRNLSDPWKSSTNPQQNN